MSQQLKTFSFSSAFGFLQEQFELVAGVDFQVNFVHKSAFDDTVFGLVSDELICLFFHGQH
jgi:hypothetical protein